MKTKTNMVITGIAACVLVLSVISGSLAIWGLYGKSKAASPATHPGEVATQESPAPTETPREDIKKTPEPTGHQQPQESLVIYTGQVRHIFFHPLVAYPELAFDNDSMSKGYNDWMITVKEFDGILNSLYKNNYILIDIHSLYEEKIQNGKKVLSKRELLLPKGKKPLIISIDDMNYYDYMLKNGNVYKLLLDAGGNIATYSVTPGGEKKIAYDNEIVPILDRFVQDHPDFSFKGAKGIIALTGYQGILGYRTNKQGSPDYESEKAEALKVVKRLKETGWSFASHGYGHLDAKKISLASLTRDTLRWKSEVEPLIGPTSIYIFPFGSAVLSGNPKFDYLLQSGFNVFCGIGPNANLTITPGYMYMERRHIDGVAFKYQRSLLADMFDVNQVIDSARPK